MFVAARFLFGAAIVMACTGPLFAKHAVLLHGKKGLVKVEANGEISWQMDWGGIHDLHVLGVVTF